MPFKEILTEEDFCRTQKEGTGFIAITDANKCRIHSVKCPNVELHYFKTKVIQNNRKNGSYFWSDEIKTLKNKWKNSDDCLHCNYLY